MRGSRFDCFIRSGGAQTFTTRRATGFAVEVKQVGQTAADAVRRLLETAWSGSFMATTRAILRSSPFEFSATGLSDLDNGVVRADALRAVLAAMDREGFDPARPEGQRRALTVLCGFLNQAQQSAMEIDFYIWTTQQDARVRGSHAGRDGKIFRWDSPPERGHPTQDYGCRCYAQPLGIDGYWTRVSESVDAFTADIGRWEGNVDYMYLDSVGNVTVGKGKLLQDATSAADLPFRYRGSDELATEEDIRAEYDRIAGLFGDGGHTADYFEQFTDLYLPQSDIDHLVTEHMRGDFEPLLRMFPGFGNFPLSAQIALWDMIYNLGPSNLRTGFPRMRQAILDGDWEEAARQSHRRQPSEERNQYVFDLFMDSAQTP